MGRFGVSSDIEGTVKSIQSISGTRGSNGNTDVTITAVSNTNKAYVVLNGTTATRAGYHDPVIRSGAYNSLCGARLTSTTNVRVSMPNLDIFADDTFGQGNRTSSFQGFVVEVF